MSSGRQRLLCCVFFIGVQLMCLQLFTQTGRHLIDTSADIYHGAPPIDMVYTWVNGSDERLQRHLSAAVDNASLRSDVNAASRFADKDELRYSLRSVATNAPWIRHVYIVTNGQVPHWLNLASGLVTVVPHSAIFEDTSTLPTFSSPAIEANLHRIPGLAKHFIYMNDDFLVASPVEYAWFYTNAMHQDREYLLAACASDCEWKRVGDGECDAACSNVQCQMDGGDCDNGRMMPPPEEAPPPDSKTSTYQASLQYTQRLLNVHFGYESRFVMPHMPMIFDRDAMAAAWEEFPVQMRNTSAGRFRGATDVQFQMFHAYYARYKRRILSLDEWLSVERWEIDKQGCVDGVREELREAYVDWSEDKEKAGSDFDQVYAQCASDDVNCDVISGRVHRQGLADCVPLCDLLAAGALTTPAYPSTWRNASGSDYYAFVLLHSNVAQTKQIFRRFKLQTKLKFICLNDDLTYTPMRESTNQRVYQLIREFYEERFPTPSPYELPEGTINEFAYLEDYESGNNGSYIHWSPVHVVQHFYTNTTTTTMGCLRLWPIIFLATLVIITILLVRHLHTSRRTSYPRVQKYASV